MEALLHQVFAGLATGGIYASLALALVMIYQVTHLVNFAQGELAICSTYSAWAHDQRGPDATGSRSSRPSRCPSCSAWSSSAS